jgi:threonine dehydratase
VVLVALGGGGLVGGIATAIKESRAGVRVVGVETEAMPTMRAALREGRPVRLDAVRTIADGITPAQVGALPFDLVSRLVDEVVTVDDEEIAEAILTLLEQEKTVAEGAGAAPLAALLHRELGLVRRTVVVVVGGGNIDVNLLSRIIERGLTKSGRIMQARVTLPDRPGSLAQLLALIAERAANILRVDHDRHATRLDQASVEIQAETRGFDHISEILDAIRAQGFLVGEP